MLRILLNTPARLPSFLSDFLASQGNYKQDASAVPGVRWVAERQWRDQSARSDAASPSLQTCRPSGDNHEHPNAKTGDAAGKLPA